MTQLEFWQENADRVFATVPLRQQGAVPATGDIVYVPEEKDTGAYAYARVICRRFYDLVQSQVTGD